MTIDEARDLFAYSAWANTRIFDAAEALTAGQAVVTVASSFPSVRGTLAHVVGAEWIWLRRWLGDNPKAAPVWVAEASLPELRAHLAAVGSEREAYLAGLEEGDLERVVEYRRLSGEADAARLADLVRHVVNHSTYHRGQVVTQLRQVGASPPGTDFIAYVRSRR